MTCGKKAIVVSVPASSPNAVVKSMSPVYLVCFVYLVGLVVCSQQSTQQNKPHQPNKPTDCR
jgi:hypothetical protein